jgi:hypothetical protein
MDNFPAFPKFDGFADENSLGVRWEKYLKKLENVFVGLGINTRKRKKHCYFIMQEMMFKISMIH